MMLLEEEGTYHVTLIADETFAEESEQKGELKVSFVIHRENLELEKLNEEDYYLIDG
jgi:hypothetical protein